MRVNVCAVATRVSVALLVVVAATLSVGVLAAETPEAVAESVDLHVRGVPACAATLLEVAAQLRRLPPPPA